MKSKPNPFLRRLRPSVFSISLSATVLSLNSAQADAGWNGNIDTHYSNTGNWSQNPAGEQLFINRTPTTYPVPVISSTPEFTPNNIFVGNDSTAGGAGRLDHTAGTAGTGNGNWMWVGRQGGTGVYNLADTNTTGGTLTELGLGGGSMNVGGTDVNGGRLFIGADSNSNGTLNINTSGTLKIGNDLFVAVSGGKGVANMDAGTVNRNSGWTAIGVDANSDGTFSMSGGTVTGNGDSTQVGANNGTGKLNVSGGTYIENGGGGIVLGRDNGNGTVNLTGGTIQTHTVSKGSGTGAFNFNGGTLKATADNGNFMTGLTAANVLAGGAVIDTNNFAVTMGQTLLAGSPSGGLTKNGPGTLTLTAFNTYTGGTTVNGGTLNLNAGGFAGAIRGTLDINSGATVNAGAVDALGWGGGQSVTQININGGTLNNGVAGNNGLQASLNLTGGTVSSTGGGDFNMLGDTTSITSNASATSSLISAPIQIRNANTTLAINVADGAAASDLEISGVIKNSAFEAGANGISKNGAGTLTLSGANTYTGVTAVNAGKLVVTNTIGSSSVTVINVGTILASDAAANIGSGVTINSGAILAVGDVSGTGVATVGNDGVALAEGSIFEWDLDAGTSDPGALPNQGVYDQLTTTGGLSTTGTGATFKIDLLGNSFTDAFWNTTKTWENIFAASGLVGLTSIFTSFSGTDVSASGLVLDEGQFTLNGSNSTLTWTAVPEPSSALAGVLLGLGLLRRRRVA